MKDMKTMEHGKPKSKEFAFIAYSQHEDALNALRNLNNNPNIFKNGTRLIVDFAIENLKAINARKKRELQSKLKNPTWKGRKGYIGPDDTEQKDNKKKKKKKGDGEEETEKKADFTGTIADPKIRTLPKHTGPKLRHNAAPKISRKDLKFQKKEKKRNDPNNKRIRTVKPDNTSDEPVAKK